MVIHPLKVTIPAAAAKRMRATRLFWHSDQETDVLFPHRRVLLGSRWKMDQSSLGAATQLRYCFFPSGFKADWEREREEIKVKLSSCLGSVLFQNLQFGTGKTHCWSFVSGTGLFLGLSSMQFHRQTERCTETERQTKAKDSSSRLQLFLIPPKLLVLFFGVFFFTEINSQMWEDHQKFLNQEADWAAGRSVKNMQFACTSHSENMCRKRRGLVQLEHLWSSRNNLVLTEKCLQIPQILHGCWWTGYHQGRGLSILSYIIT